MDTLTALIKAVANKKYHCLAVSGKSGSGKTWQLMTALKEANVDFFYVNGHLSPYGLYRTLYLNRNKLIIFDDCDEIWQSDTMLGIMKAVLDTGIREVSWLSHAKLGEDFVSSFEFTGSVIIVVNSVTRERNPHVRALLSRAIFWNHEPSRQELLDTLRNIDNVDKEVVELIDQFSPQVDLRDYKKLVALKSAYPQTWKAIALRIISPDEELAFVYNSITNATPKHQAISEYRERFQKSERSWYRKQKELGKIAVMVPISY